MPAFLPMVALLLALSAGACGGESVPTAPSGPVSQPPPAALSVLSAQPQVAFGGSSLLITGTGFVAGASVTLGGAMAFNTIVNTSSQIRLLSPGGTGTVDVVVTNPNGQSARLPAGFTYNVVTLNPNLTVVAALAEITVAWTAAHARCSSDWIGVYQPGMRNEDYGLWAYTSCGMAGTLRFVVPLRGQFEFRYLLDDGYQDVARVAFTVE